jgi:hypothetical protein
MIDVILYGKDAKGRLTLRECRFGCLRELSSYLSSPKAARWEWAEIETSTEPGQKQIVHYTADSLRKLVMSSSRTPSIN